MSFLRGFWRGSSKHKKLCEEWALANSRECIESGNNGLAGLRAQDDPTLEDSSEAKFMLKYLGSTLVETPSSEEATAEAIKTVITMAKASGKKLQRVLLTISLRGIRMTDLTTEEDQLEISIYRISYCSADATHDHVFAFIATNFNETMECHAFLCPKKKLAQTVTLTVAQAFSTAYEAWQLAQAAQDIDAPQDPSSSLINNDIRVKKGSAERKRENENQEARAFINEKLDCAERENGQKLLLIDLSNELKLTKNPWVSVNT